MTVERLIEYLQELPKNLEVAFVEEGSGDLYEPMVPKMRNDCRILTNDGDSIQVEKAVVL